MNESKVNEELMDEIFGEMTNSQYSLSESDYSSDEGKKKKI